MKFKFLVSAGFVIMLAIIVVLTFRIAFLQRFITDGNGALSARMAAFESSVITLDKQVGFLKDQIPGLGEYMSGLQFHMAKMWFAAQASNWDLADYELHETSEAIDAVAGLNVSRNNVDISDEIKSVLGSQIANLQKAIDEQSLAAFTASYNKALETCNNCHGSSGYRFIHVTTPSSPPVTNQAWEKVSPGR